MVRKAEAGGDDGGFDVFHIENPSIEFDDEFAVVEVGDNSFYTVERLKGFDEKLNTFLRAELFNLEGFGADVVAETRAYNQKCNNGCGFKNCFFHAQKIVRNGEVVNLIIQGRS